jgi:hypothetical protein
MKRIFQFLLTTTLLLVYCSQVVAQIYEANPLGHGKRDTAIVVFKYAAPEGDKSLRTPVDNFYLKEDTVLMRGTKLKMKDKVEVTYYDNGFFSMFTIFAPDKRPLASMTDSTGKAYYVDPIELKFSEENPEGTENPLAKYTEMRKSTRSYYRGDHLIAIWIFLWLTWRISRRASKIGLKKYSKGTLKRHNWLIGLLLFIAPLLYFIIVVSEIDMVTSMGSDCCWWLNGAYVGDFTRLFLILMLYMAMRWQYKMIDAYATGMEAFLCTPRYVPRKEIMFGIIVSVILFIVIFFIGMCLYTWVGATVGTVAFYIAFIAGGGMLAYTLISQFITMKQAAGWILSFVYLLFIILWAIGTLIIIGVFVWQFTKIIIPFLVLGGFGKMIPALKLDKPSAPMKWYDNAGGVHDSAGARDRRNEALESYK